MKYKLGEKTIGVFNKTTKVLRKRVLKSKHLFRKGNEWGIDYKMIESLPEGSKIVLEELEEGKWYWLSKEEIKTLGREFIGYSGYGLQRMIPVSDWHTLTPEQAEENEYRKTQGLELKYIP